MAELAIMRAQGGYVPADPMTEELMASHGFGQVIRGKFTKMRNPLFHRKYFVMLKYAFDTWQPEDASYNGMPAVKNFDRFRKDIAIKTGFHDLVVRVDGSVKAEARSISFASMDESEFSDLYQKTLTFLINTQIFSNHTPEDIERTVNNLLGQFA